MVSRRDRATMTTTAAPAASRLTGIWYAHWGTGLACLALGAGVVGWGYDAAVLGRFVVGGLAAMLVQMVAIAAWRRRIGPEAASLADWLTLGRAAAGSLLAGLVAGGEHDRLGLAGWLGCLVLLLGATVTDWLDGPLVRRRGPTRLGAALDIEADSWITLWAGAAGIAWGGLPWVVVIAPLLHYLHPLRAWLAGQVPQSDGVAWARVPGTAQMVLFAAALLPIASVERDAWLTWAAYPVAAAQSLTMLLTLRRR